jgi:hypothetical protein
MVPKKLQSFDGALEPEAAIKQRIVELRDRGVSATPVNTRPSMHQRLAALACGTGEGPSTEKRSKKLNPDHVKRQVAFRPKGLNSVRTHTAALLRLDGGYRISEVVLVCNMNTATCVRRQLFFPACCLRRKCYRISRCRGVEAARSAARAGGDSPPAVVLCAEHARQLGGESPLDNLMEVKS